MLPTEPAGRHAEATAGRNTGGYVTTNTIGGTNWIYHVFTNAGASGMKFRATAAGGTVELLVVAGGGSGGGTQYDGGAGGAGVVILRYVIPAPPKGTVFLLR